ncbi:unnamed protein product [Cuscuta epithymum]|uniref:Cytosine-specific methyltransferase n=1 Tax=Cuscuta epithymum TaxID=186058 RepID=A0AAV0FBK6_9ASTE|nr:unnamed protein product [Cuscuta epithymum]
MEEKPDNESPSSPPKISPPSSTSTPSSSKSSIRTRNMEKTRDALALPLYADTGNESPNKNWSSGPALLPAGSPAQQSTLSSPAGLEFHKKRTRSNEFSKLGSEEAGSPTTKEKSLALPEAKLKSYNLRNKCSKPAISTSGGKKCLKSRQYKRSNSPEVTSKSEALNGNGLVSEDGNEIVSKRIDSPKSSFKKKAAVSKDEWMATVSSDSAESSGERRSPDKNVKSLKCLRSQRNKFGVVSERKVTRTSALGNGRGSESKELASKGNVSHTTLKSVKNNHSLNVCFVGEPIPAEEAQERWRWRYDLKSLRRNKRGQILSADEEDEVILNVGCHYAQANICGFILNIGDCAFIKGEGAKKHVGRILEFFETTEGEDYFRVQWFFRAEDTVMKDAATVHDKRRLFYSTLMNDNLLDCIISKVNVTEISPGLDFQVDNIRPSDFYYDMEYCIDYSTFRNLPTVCSANNWTSPSLIDALYEPISAYPVEHRRSCEPVKVKWSLLDLYAGCGGMSTGLCLGAKLSGINLVTKWAVDCEKSACDSLKLNHPETHVRNEPVENFLKLVQEWENLCKVYGLNDSKLGPDVMLEDMEEGGDTIVYLPDSDDSDAEYEILRLVDICFGDPNGTGKSGIHFQVRWKGFGSSEDTWEPIDGLKNSKESIDDFVRRGKISKILPLPGDVDVICGGPPCQGISGYNRHRNVNAPLEDERNRQIIIFMDVVEFLRPKYVLMENVIDILRFDNGSLGRYALSRLVRMRYQTRLGILAAGCYGLPQFRLRAFILGALHTEKLPPFPLPTHDVIFRYGYPSEFERNVVAYDEGQPRELEEALVLQDAISDLPAVTSREIREEMPYCMPPESDFQKYIRLPKHEIMGSTPSSEVRKMKDHILYDHRPLLLSEDNITRVSLISHRKGANFLDFPGVILVNNTATRDPNKEPVLLPSGRQLVPDCIFTFQQGKSKRPFARLWWDETVSTLVTFPNIFSNAILHPDQDRVLTIRECARLQGFPDFYRFCGTVPDRYCQVGNAVAVPVGRALGYALGIAFQRLCGDEPLIKLPPNFTFLQPSIDKIEK